ncbi:MAG: hypothetical protein KDI92_03720 [Xanthomonadales bacterium]|nr:hypothetical protein [Xanthomonadales bacterium]
MKKILTIAIILLLAACDENQDYSDMPDFHKPVRGDYWAVRYTYPTFQYQQHWWIQAQKAHEKNPQKTPLNRDRYLANFNGLNPGAFTALGPKPLGEPNGTAFSGRVNVIVTHPLDSSIAYMGVDGGGVWKTTDCCDEQTSWQNITDNTAVHGGAIGDLYIDPNDANIIYAGTGDLRYGSYSFGSAGLLRSKDAGTTWEVLGEDVFSPYRSQAPGEFPQYQAIGRVRTNPLDSTQIVVGTKTGVYFSYNDGVDWSDECYTHTFNAQRHDVTGMEVSSAGDIYIAIGTRGHNTPVQPDLDQNGANGIYKTTFPASGCPSWTLVTTSSNGWPTGTGEGTPFPTNQLGRIDLAMAPSDNDVLYAQVADINTRAVKGVWKTSDGGTNWTQVATTSDFIGCSGSGSQAWYDMGMSVSPTDPDELFLSAVDVFKSSNGGDTFTNSTCGYLGGPNSGDFVHVDQHARAYVAGDPSKLLVGGDGGIYYTNNADTAQNNARDIIYTQLNNTVNTIEFYSGDISADFLTTSDRFIVGGAQDNGSSVAAWNNNDPLTAKNWTPVYGGDGIYTAIEPMNGQRVYVESQYGNIGISTSGPFGNYNQYVNPWSNDSRVPFIFPFHINKHYCDVNACNQLMAGTYRIWETANGGLNDNGWYINSPDLTKGTLSGRSIINQMHYNIPEPGVTPTDKIAIVGTNDGNVYYGFGMGHGIANSASWVNVTDSNSVLPNRPILDVVTFGSNAQTGYAAVGGFNQNTPSTPGHLFQINCDTDCGVFEWKNKSGNLPNIPVDSVMINPHIPEMVFAGTDWGVYYTEDISVDTPLWYRFTDGIPSVMIWDLVIDRGMTTLAAFTRSRGAYVWPLPQAIDNDLIFKDDFE